MQSSLKIIVLIKRDFTGKHQGSREVGSVRSISNGREHPSYVPNGGWRAEGFYTKGEGAGSGRGGSVLEDKTKP